MNFLARFGIPLALTISELAFYNSAQASAVTTEQLEAAFCSHPDPKTVTALRKLDPDFQCKAAAPVHATARQSISTDNPSTTKSGNGETPSKKDMPIGAEFKVPAFFLRNDWTDLGLLGAGCTGSLNAVTADKAKGAAVSFTRDYAANNRIWAAQGMVGAVYSDCLNIPPAIGGTDHALIEKSIAVYAQINSDYNSSAQLAKKNNVDTRTAGLSGELAYLTGADYNVLRVTPNVVFDNIKGTTAFAVMTQYIPVWLSLPGVWSHYNLFGTFWFQFDPTLDFQYSNAMGHSGPLEFSGKDQSFRIGPELTFIVTPLNIAGSYLRNIGISETFHPWYETYSRRGSYWWANTIFYNFTDNFALAFSYNRGLDQNSGTMTNQYIASLTGKY